MIDHLHGHLRRRGVHRLRLVGLLGDQNELCCGPMRASRDRARSRQFPTCRLPDDPDVVVTTPSPRWHCCSPRSYRGPRLIASATSVELRLFSRVLPASEIVACAAWRRRFSASRALRRPRRASARSSRSHAAVRRPGDGERAVRRLVVRGHRDPRAQRDALRGHARAADRDACQRLDVSRAARSESARPA